MALLCLRPQYKVGRNLVQPPKELRLLDAGQAVTKLNCPSVSLTSVYIGKVIPKCHNVNRFTSNLALTSFELAAVEMSTALSAM